MNYLYFTFALLLLQSGTLTRHSDQKGILIFPISVNGVSIGEPGQIIDYSITDSTHGVISLIINGSVFPHEHTSSIIPFDSIFAPARIYLYLASKEPMSDNDILKEAGFRLQLAKNACTIFQFHPLYEEFLVFYCRCAEKHETLSSDFKDKPSLAIAVSKQYLAAFPNGPHRDLIEWNLLKLQNWVCEYEGHASSASAQISAYELFLANHPTSTMANAIKLEIAHLCRVVVECLRYNLDVNLSEGFVSADTEKYRARALALYHELAESPAMEVRQEAIVASFNMQHGRSTYYGAPHDW